MGLTIQCAGIEECPRPPGPWNFRLAEVHERLAHDPATNSLARDIDGKPAFEFLATRRTRTAHFANGFGERTTSAASVWFGSDLHAVVQVSGRGAGKGEIHVRVLRFSSRRINHRSTCNAVGTGE